MTATTRNPGGSGGIAALLLAMLIALVMLGCGPAQGDAYLMPFRKAQRAYHAGRYEEAIALFEEASTQAARIKDRDEAMFMQARMYRKLERWDDARGVYRKLIETSPDGPRSARAVYEYAGLEIEHGEAQEGWRLLHDALDRYPNHGSARRTLPEYVKHVQELVSAGESAPGSVEELLRGWMRKHAGTDIEQQLKYLYAEVLEQAGNLEEARDQYLATGREHPYPKGSLTDDALLRASRVAERLGRFQQAVDHLRELLATREDATGGSYERPRFPEAQMRIAQLYRDKLDDLASARREFRKVYEHHTTSVLADDAMWQESLLAVKQGDAAGACDIARDFAGRFPESRYRPCLKELCPSLDIRDKRQCRRYILEELKR